MHEILIIDDDANIREIIAKSMEYEGYRCIEAEDGPSGLSSAQMPGADLILLDLMLPGMDGITVLKNLRSSGVSTPVIILTAKGDEADKVIGLGFGADDYLVKPFSVRELAARVEAVLRRASAQTMRVPSMQPVREDEAVMQKREKTRAGAEGIFSVGSIEIDIARHEVRCGGTLVDLSLKEFDLLRILAENHGRVLTRAQLLDKVWGYDYTGETRTVDVHVRFLRRKLGENSIVTVRGLGYKFIG
jgi:DNA-binding response OmpR family regulator